MKRVLNWLSAPAFLLALGLTFNACQEQPSTLQPVTGSEARVGDLVEAFYTPADETTVRQTAKAYEALSKAEMDLFIDLDYQRRLKKGDDKIATTLHRDFRKDVNKMAFAKFSKPYNALNEAEAATVGADLAATGKYAAVLGAKAVKGARAAACTAWNTTGSIVVRNQGVVNWTGNTYLGEYSFCYPGQACQTDCDLLFRSRNYSRYYYSAYLWYSTTSAMNVLMYGGCTSCSVPSRRIAVNSSEEYLQFGTGQTRVFFNYGYGYQNFANEVIVKLTVR